MVDVSIPAGTLGLLIDPITKFLFLNAYKVSHEEHLEHYRPGKRFHALGRFLEYDIHLESDHVSNATVPMSFLILRNISDRTFHRVDLLVEADAGSVKYQDFTTLIDVGSTPLVVHLPRIPLKEMDVQNNVKNPDLTVGVSPQLKLRLSRILLALMFDVALDHRLIDTNRRHKVTV